MVAISRTAYALALLCPLALAASSSTVVASATAGNSLRPYGTIAPNADDGQPVIANIYDPQAVDPQAVCSGYKASDVTHQAYGLKATLTLAGQPCNVYGDDVESLDLTVQYQSADRVHVEIAPTYMTSGNQSWFVPPAGVVRAATLDADANSTVPLNDLEFVYGNSPSFWMKMLRKSTSEVLFDTSNFKLVFENQFVEFVTALPEDYNLYGLGETIHALR